MNSLSELEVALGERLEHRAAQIQVAARPRLDAALHRRSRARRTRALSAGAATVSLAAVVAVTAVGLLRGGTPTVLTTVPPAGSTAAGFVTTLAPTTSGPVPTAAVGPVTETSHGPAPGTVPVPATTAAEFARGVLPRLALQVAGANLAYASVGGAATLETIPASEAVWLQVYRVSGRHTPPMLAVQIVPPGVRFGIGDAAPDEITTVVDVHGMTGYLVDDPATVTPTVGWRLGDGSAVYVQGVGIPADDLLVIALDILPGTDGALRPLRLPYGLELAHEGPLDELEPATWYEMAYTDPDVEIRVASAGESAFESLVLDRAASAESVEGGTVRGEPAALVDYARVENDFALLWTERDGSVRVELRLRVSREEVPGIVASLVELDGPTWARLLEQADVAEIASQIEAVLADPTTTG